MKKALLTFAMCSLFGSVIAQVNKYDNIFVKYTKVDKSNLKYVFNEDRHLNITQDNIVFDIEPYSYMIYLPEVSTKVEVHSMDGRPIQDVFLRAIMMIRIYRELVTK